MRGEEQSRSIAASEARRKADGDIWLSQKIKPTQKRNVSASKILALLGGGGVCVWGGRAKVCDEKSRSRLPANRSPDQPLPRVLLTQRLRSTSKNTSSCIRVQKTRFNPPKRISPINEGLHVGLTNPCRGQERISRTKEGRDVLLSQ